MPAIGCADARAYVIADPLHTMTILFTGEDVEADLRPARNAFGEFERPTKVFSTWPNSRLYGQVTLR